MGAADAGYHPGWHLFQYLYRHRSCYGRDRLRHCDRDALGHFYRAVEPVQIHRYLLWRYDVKHRPGYR